MLYTFARNILHAMAGIYIHIPFCKKVCTYCDFYKSTVTSLIPGYLDAIDKEIRLREDYLDRAMPSTIYIGGGTPSLLGIDELEKLFTSIYRYHSPHDGAEVTLEANPDDLSTGFLADLRKYTPVNRLSIGIQSFHETDLITLGRRHSAIRAVQAIEEALRMGFDNLTADLIYGLPGMDLKGWEANLRKVFSFGLRHLSAYHLTIEPGTTLARRQKKGLLSLPEEDESRKQFQLLHTLAGEYGFEHYEISNLAKPGFRSRHNAAYWKQQPYLGLGPSAHSYNGVSRQWNLADVRGYVDGMQKNQAVCELEYLNEDTRYNEFIMLSLRTAEGLDLQALATNFGESCARETEHSLNSLMNPGWMIREGHQIRLSMDGWMVSDYIAGKLMRV
jgi:oxygen-independent coproporphyrinogen-3 oxidase